MSQSIPTAYILPRNFFFLISQNGENVMLEFPKAGQNYSKHEEISTANRMVWRSITD